MKSLSYASPLNKHKLIKLFWWGGGILLKIKFEKLIKIVISEIDNKGLFDFSFSINTFTCINKTLIKPVIYTFIYFSMCFLC